ncbi:MAG: hypothetical protein ABSA97_02520 [Verrucomicrobiia bacterium]
MNVLTQLHQHKEAKIKNSFRAVLLNVIALRFDRRIRTAKRTSQVTRFGPTTMLGFRPVALQLVTTLTDGQTAPTNGKEDRGSSPAPKAPTVSG